MPKPNDLLVNIVSLLSMLLPGGLFTAALLAVTRPMEAEPFNALLSSTGAGWVAFILTSYALGHFLFHVAALMDRPMLKLLKPLMWTQETDALAEAIERAQKSYFGSRAKLARMPPYRWSKSLLRLKAASAVAEVDQYEAEAKFFRTLLVALPLSAALLAWSGFWEGLVIAAVLSPLSFLRYGKLRLQSVEASYRYALLLLRNNHIFAASAEIDAT